MRRYLAPLLIVLLACGLLGVLLTDMALRSAQQIIVSTDSLRTYRNREQQWVAERTAHEGTVSSLKAALGDSSASSQALRRVLRRATQQAAYWRSVSVGTVTGTTQSEAGQSDTVQLRDTVVIYRYPIYRFEHVDAWARLSVRAGRDSTQVDYSITNAYTFTLNRAGSWFRPSTRAEVTNLNPHTQTKELVAFTVRQPSRWGVGPYVGLGFSPCGVQPSVGLAVHYDLIRW